MDTKIGLFSPKDEIENKEVDANFQMVFYSHSFTMEYESLMQRLAIPIDICQCTDESPLFRIKALWDTGAMTSCISDKMARKIGLKPIDNGIGVTPAGQIEIQYYFVDIYLSRDIVIPNIKVAGFPLEKHDTDFLIGMDVIKKGNLCIKSTDGKTTIIFETTDQ